MAKGKKAEKDPFYDDQVCKVSFVFDGNNNRYHT